MTEYAGKHRPKKLTWVDLFGEERGTLQDKRKIVNDLSFYEHVFHFVDFSYPDIYDLGEDATPEQQHEASQARKAVDFDVANVISSRLRGRYASDGPELVPLHTVAIDVDHRVRVVPSTTSEHYHLYIDVPMPWPKYLKLLEALAEAGIVEPGYVEASKRREATHLRLPWVRKDPEQLAARAERIKAAREAQKPALVADDDPWGNLG